MDNQGEPAAVLWLSVKSCPCINWGRLIWDFLNQFYFNDIGVRSFILCGTPILNRTANTTSLNMDRQDMSISVKSCPRIQAG